MTETQSPMSAYIIFTRVRTRSPKHLSLYAEQAPAFLAGHSINWLAHFGTTEVLEGAGAESSAILEFESMEAARAWYHSPAYQAASEHRYIGGDYSVVLVEGAAPKT
jgi:uncharacterized protein (DUF1330 family)